ncbi:hypothetical protein Q7P35_007018 [Cladosporium inversicolor]
MESYLNMTSAVTFPNITSKNGSQQPMFIAVTATLYLLSFCVVSARFYCRIVFTKKVGLDDYFIALALLVVTILAIFNGFQISWGVGIHASRDYTLDAYIHTLKYWYAYQIIYPLSLATTKLSFLALYYRVFPPPTMNRVFFWGTTGIIVVYTIIIMFVNAFECPNPSDAWLPSFPSPECNDLKGSYYSMAGINIATDLLVLILPIKPALGLQVNRRRKYAVVGIFMIGSIAVIASMIRIHALWAYFHSKDMGYDAIGVLLWGQIELNVAIVCASAASLRPLFGSAFAGSGPRSRSGHAQYRSSRNYGLGSSHFGDTVALSMRKGPETKIEAELHGMQDGDSQELILSHEDGIKRTRETNVTSESAGTHDIHGK